jgi:hypothetical protein
MMEHPGQESKAKQSKKGEARLDGSKDTVVAGEEKYIISSPKSPFSKIRFHHLVVT